MDIYVYLLLFLAIAALIEIKGKSDFRVDGKYPSFCFILSVLVLTFISAFRFDVGQDYPTYYSDYISINNGDTFTTERYELGYLALNKLLGVFFSDPQAIFISTSILINLLIACFILRNSRYPQLSLFCYVSFYFYFSSFNIVRQFVAMSILFWGLTFLLQEDKKNVKKFILTCLIASQFHTSAILGLMYLVLLKVRLISMQKRMLIVLILPVLIVIPKVIASLFVRIFPKYVIYMEYGKGGNSDAVLFILLVVLLLLWVINRNIRIRIANFNFYYNCVLFSLFLNCLSSINILFYRVGILFSFTLILLLPEILYHMNEKSRVVSKFVLIVIAFIYCIWNISNNNAYVTPYSISF